MTVAILMTVPEPPQKAAVGMQVQSRSAQVYETVPVEMVLFV